MANRDKSQKIGFVYTNIYELYKKSKAAAEQGNAVSPAGVAAQAGVGAQAPNSRILSAEDSRILGGEIKVTKFEPRILAKPTAEEARPAAAAKSTHAFEDLKANIN